MRLRRREWERSRCQWEEYAFLCRTNKGMMLELLKFRNQNGCDFSRRCYPKEEQAPPNITVVATFQQTLKTIPPTRF